MKDELGEVLQQRADSASSKYKPSDIARIQQELQKVPASFALLFPLSPLSSLLSPLSSLLSPASSHCTLQKKVKNMPTSDSETSGSEADIINLAPSHPSRKRPSSPHPGRVEIIDDEDEEEGGGGEVRGEGGGGRR